MKNFEKTTYSKAEKRYLSIIFFLFGISIMSLAPRTPDLKSNLAVNNGTFGTLLGSASIGSIVMLLIGGQIVHTIGAKRAMQIGSTVIALTYIALVSTSSPIIFLICNILAGSGVSIFHIASSGHSLHRQDEVGKVIVPKLHGAWAAGAMSTAAVAFLISNQISITSHISTLMVCFWVATQISLRKLTPTFPKKPAADDSYRASSVKQFKFKINWFLSLGFFCASIMEFTIADWATLFGKEELGMGSSVATLSYLIYLIGLIIGRYSIGWALKHQSEQFWIKTGGLVGGVGLSSMLFTATVVVDINKNLGFFIAFLGFFLAGLGSSALAPIFFSIAGRLSNGKNALAVAQLSFVNTFVIFVAKNILAWIVQISSIMIALVITSILMAALLYFGRVGSADRQ
ncbi:MAG: MFS transporter [Actinobacteria bacterium]|nr:MFS transporter [Actinomycetota bacterium]